MNNRRLRALIVRLQDRLSEDDRKRLHFFLGNDVPRRIRDDPSLGGTLSLMESLFDQDKISDDDFTFLINAFDEIQCLDAVKLLREHMRQMQTNGVVGESVQSLSALMPPLLDNLLDDQEDDKPRVQLPLINRDICSNNNNIIINSNNNNISLDTNIDSNVAILSASTRKQVSITNCTTQGKLLVLYTVLMICLIGLIIVGSIWTVHLNRKYKQLLNEPKPTNITHSRELLLSLNDTLYRLESTLNDDKSKNITRTTVNYNELFLKLKVIVTDYDDDMQLTEGTTCGCAQWCTERGSLYGVCGTGHTCICTSSLIEKDSVGENCRCNRWCRRHNYKNGGICGDGFTCICSA